MIKAIIFDGFSTLIETADTSVEATDRILKANNISHITAREFYTVWKRFHRENIENSKEFITEAMSFTLSLDKTFKHFQINGDAQRDVELMLSIIGKRGLYGEVKEVISELRKKYLVCIGSNTDTSPLIETVTRNSLWVDYIYTSEDLRVYKPNERFYRLILEDLGLAPSEVLFCGDSLIDDVFGPQQLGIKACHINRRNEKSQTISPDYELNSLEGLPLLVDNIK